LREGDKNGAIPFLIFMKIFKQFPGSIKLAAFLAGGGRADFSRSRCLKFASR